MLIAHTADLHLDERAHEPLDDQVARLEWIGADAKKAGAKLLVCSGDVFHRRSTAAERNAALVAVVSWANRFPVVIVKGNNSHDGPGEVDFLGRLRTANPVRVCSAAEHFAFSDFSVCALAFPEKQWLAARLAAGADITQASLACMRTILSGFSASWADGLPRILVAHAEIGAAVTEAGQPMVGRCFIELAEDDLLSSGADYVALGHIHKAQTLGDRIRYAGSPRQIDFGEGCDKGYSLVDVIRGKAPVIEHRETPGRRLVTVNYRWDDLEASGLLPDSGEDADVTVGGALVRLVYEVDDGHREEAARHAAAISEIMKKAGALDIRLEPRVTMADRVRSEEIRVAATDADRLRALWSSRGGAPANAETIMAKLAEIGGTR